MRGGKGVFAMRFKSPREEYVVALVLFGLGIGAAFAFVMAALFEGGR